MATNLTRRGARANNPALLPALPDEQGIADAALRMRFQLIREWLEVRLGARGDFYERAVTHRELEAQLAQVMVDAGVSDEDKRLLGLLNQLGSQLQGLVRQVSLVQSILNQTVDNSNTAITNIYNQVRDVAVEDVVVFARDMLPSVTGGCSALTTIEFSSTKPNFHALLFDKTTDESADFHAMLPFSWAGRMFRVYVYWGHGAGGTTFGTTWEVTANSTSDNESVILDFVGGAVITDTGGTSGNLYIAAYSDPIPIASNINRNGDLVSLRIYRRPTHASDNLDIDAALLAVRFTLSDVPFPVTCVMVSGDILLHCHFEGTDGDTTWPDVSPYLRTITGNSVAKLSNLQSKFGTTSLRFTAGVELPVISVTGSEWGRSTNQPFTIACWVYHAASTNYELPLFARWYTPNASQYDHIANQGTTAKVAYDNEQFGAVMTAVSYSTGQWVHFELGYDGTTIYLFADGVTVYSGARSLGADTTGTFFIGINSSGSGASDATDIYLGELIVVQNECLHTADFTPPTVPYCEQA